MEMSITMTKHEIVNTILLDLYNRGAKNIKEEDIKIIPHTDNKGELDHLNIHFSVKEK